MSQGSSAATATQQAYQAIWGMVQRQAAMLSYNDTFLFMSPDVRCHDSVPVPAAQAEAGQGRSGDDALMGGREKGGILLPPMADPMGVEFYCCGAFRCWLRHLL